METDIKIIYVLLLVLFLLMWELDYKLRNLNS